MTRLAIALLVTLLAFVRVAHADDPAMRAAKRHYDRGEKLFALGKFDDALDEYQKAFDAKPLPGFLFNIGQCHRNLGNLDQAIFSYKKYLTLEPEADNKEKVEQLIAELEQKKAEADTNKFGLGNNQNPPPGGGGEPSKPIYKKWWFWTGVGAVAVAGGVGTYLVLSGGPPGTDLGNYTLGK